VAENLPPEARGPRRKIAALQTEGDCWDAAAAVLFLASDQARWISGQVLVVAAGRLDLRDERFANVPSVCEEIGRDPSTLRMSATMQAMSGATKGEAEQRLERLGPPGARMLANGVVGAPSDLIAALEGLANDGCESVYLHIFDIDDLDHLRLIGAEVLPQLA
jgi:hypothetical protein